MIGFYKGEKGLCLKTMLSTMLNTWKAFNKTFAVVIPALLV